MEQGLTLNDLLNFDQNFQQEILDKLSQES